ncbi:MAG TPA: M28 family metallopeptidase [Solimonas sp.]|nr:M28 family metallopeptidase [Solimonas sp.]
MKSLIPASCLGLLAALAASACGTSLPRPDGALTTFTAPVETPVPDAARASIRSEDLLRHIEVLASDRFEGRAPGTRGEDRTVEYLVEQFKAMGLQPGNPDGSYVQDVPLVGIDGTPSLTLWSGRKQMQLRHRRDFVATTARFVPRVDVKKSELVFVGYGVQAPEYGWDDYKGLDVKGKTLVMLINDPAIPDPDDPTQLDAGMFRGKAMTYYGRWTYKYEIASKLGAAAAIIVHETAPASYPWDVVQNSWTGEQFELAAADGNMSRVPAQAWITLERARELFAASGQDFEALKKAALSRDFQPVPLKAIASFSIRNKVRKVASRNVVARLPGRDRPDETVVYSAHWDHLGRDRTLKGDQIFNGAVDNASGTAGLLEIAEAYTKLPTPPQRSVLFLAVTAEEQGLLGSRHYAANPLYPLRKTVAMINMDALNPWGPTEDLQVIGYGQNELEDIAASALRHVGRRLVPDAHPEKGGYYRSDQFEFAKLGVPALYADNGSELVGKPGQGEALSREYTARDYHKPSDEVKASWDLSGAAGDMQVLLDVGYRVADSARWPEWKRDSEFRAIREASLAAP